MSSITSDGRVYAFDYSPAALGLLENRLAAANSGFLLLRVNPLRLTHRGKQPVHPISGSHPAPTLANAATRCD